MRLPEWPLIWQEAIQDTLEESANNDVDTEIKNYRVLTSYNWITTAKRSSTIAVPGHPPFWRANVRLPIKLVLNETSSITDQNEHYSPSSPLEPLFRAIYKTIPDFDPREIDLFTDRNNLRKLLGA